MENIFEIKTNKTRIVFLEAGWVVVDNMDVYSKFKVGDIVRIKKAGFSAASKKYYGKTARITRVGEENKYEQSPSLRWYKLDIENSTGGVWETEIELIKPAEEDEAIERIKRYLEETGQIERKSEQERVIELADETHCYESEIMVLNKEPDCLYYNKSKYEDCYKHCKIGRKGVFKNSMFVYVGNKIDGCMGCSGIKKEDCCSTINYKEKVK